MHCLRAQATVSALLCLFLAAPTAAQQPVVEPSQPEQLEPLLQPLGPLLRIRTRVGTAQDFLRAIDTTAGSTTGQLITLTDDIYLLPADLRAFTGSLPFDSGNRTLVLRGGKPGANQTLLDFGGAVNLMYQRTGMSFISYGLLLQGMPPPSAAVAAGIQVQLVASYLWPTFTGEPGHSVRAGGAIAALLDALATSGKTIASWYTTLRKTSALLCTPARALFSLHALQTLAGRNDTIHMQGDDAIFIGQRMDGAFALRNLTSGDSIGSVLYSWDHTTLQCVATPPAPAGSGFAGIDLPSIQAAPTGIAGTPTEFLFLLGSSNISRIELGAHISLREVHTDTLHLPIVLASRTLEIGSNDDEMKVLDLGRIPRLLFLKADGLLSFQRVHLEGVAPQSSVLLNASRGLPGSPLWPTVDGEPGHQLELLDCAVHAVVTPCSQNSTRLAIELLRKLVGAGQVLPVGATGYIVLPRHVGREPITDVVSGQQVGVATCTVQNTTFECEEDPGVALVSEAGLQGGGGQPPGDGGSLLPAGFGTTTTGGSGAASGSGRPGWVPAVAAAAAGTAALVLTAAALLAWRRVRAKRRAQVASTAAKGSGAGEAGAIGQGASTAGTELAPLSPRGARLDKMESAEPGDGHMLSAFAAASAASQPKAGSTEVAADGDGGGVLPCGTGRLGSDDTWAPANDPLWRSRFGVIEGLEVGELAGRGAFGKVYKGRWNGAVVAIKVVEHRVKAGDPPYIAREPLLCMSVSHPNCITTYKLTVIRLLQVDDLLATAGSQESLDAAEAAEGGTAGGGPDSRRAWKASGHSGRVLRSLLSGAEAVEVEDPYGAMQPGLYETWIVSEFCELGALSDALAEKRLTLPDGRPHMAAIYLCLLDIASGMQYLHTLGIMHSDLKPANVLLKGSRNGLRGFTCKLADFGLSRMLDGRATHIMTSSYGTATHSAPELLREGRLSPAVDVYAFAVLAWELVAGEEAFRGWHPMQIVLQVTQHGTRLPALPHCPPALAALMDRCWREDPADRPSFAEIATELKAQLQAFRQAQQGQKGQGRPSLPPARPAPPVQRSPGSQLSRQPSAVPLLLPPAPSEGAF